MAKRSLGDIDHDLAEAVRRRWINKTRIESLSAEIVGDTRWIDRLLAERSEMTEALALTGDHRGR